MAAPVYAPLDANRKEIRILIIEPNTNTSAALNLEFRIITLIDKPKFTALSYCWGTDRVDEFVLLHGQSHTITSSLGSALRQFRADAGDVPTEIWADALCINQNDKNEQSQQVSLMGELYGQAAAVKIWIGPADAETEAGFGYLAHILSGAWNGDESEKQTAMTGSTFAAFASLFRRAYWTRRWTLQEQLLAQTRTLHCGAWSAAWGVMDVMKTFVYLQRLQYLGIKDKSFWMTMNEIYPALFPLLTTIGAMTDYKEFLLDTKVNECSRSHDVVYGVLGILPKEVNIVPDYTQPVGAVLADYIYELMTKMNHLDILYQLRSTDPTLPSWVPELRAEVVKQETRWLPIADAPSHRSLQSQLYSCSGNSLPVVDVVDRPQPDILSLQAIHIDTVAAIGSTPHDYEHLLLLNPIQVRTKLPTDWWFLFSNTLNSNTPHDHTRPSSFSLSLCTCFSRPQPLKPNLTTNAHIENTLFRIYHLDQISGGAYEFSKTTYPNRSPRLTAQDIADCRDDMYAEHPLGDPSLMTFFVTKNGRAGKSIDDVRVGDCVFAVKGLEMPVVLRERKDEGVWEKVAVCYLHGAMDGEAVVGQVFGEILLG